MGPALGVIPLSHCTSEKCPGVLLALYRGCMAKSEAKPAPFIWAEKRIRAFPRVGPSATHVERDTDSMLSKGLFRGSRGTSCRCLFHSFAPSLCVHGLWGRLEGGLSNMNGGTLTLKQQTTPPFPFRSHLSLPAPKKS